VHHDPSDLGSLILILTWSITKEHTLNIPFGLTSLPWLTFTPQWKREFIVQVNLRSRHKWGRGRGARMREINGRLGDRDKGTPATKTSIISSPPTDF